MLRIRKFLVSVVAAGSLFASAFQVYALQGGDVALKAGGSHIKYDPGLDGSYYHHVTTDGEWTANIGAVAMVTDNVGIEVGMSWPAVFTTKGMVDFTSLGGGINKFSMEYDMTLLTITPQFYFMDKDQPIRPYAGLGGAYLHYRNIKLDIYDFFSAPPTTLRTKTSSDHDWAWNVQAGCIFDVNDQVFVDTSARYVRKNSDINAYTLSVNAGIRF